MTKCKEIQATYLPCDKECLGGQQVCWNHKHFISKEAAKESARGADNTFALAKAADRTSKAYALMTISATPGTEKEYTEAKQGEVALKLRVKTDDENYKKAQTAKKCNDAAALKLHEMLNIETDTTQNCYVIPSSQNLQCQGTGSTRDHLCTTHRIMLINHISIISMSPNTNVTSAMLPFRFGSDLNNHLLYEAFREGVRAARFARFGVTLAPAPAVPPPAAPHPRRTVAAPILTAPVDVAPHVAKQHLEMSLALEKPIVCPICYDAVTAENIVMTHCGHVYCTPCITSVRERERKCPQCRVTI
jgi:hypothetical protein